MSKEFYQGGGKIVSWPDGVAEPMSLTYRDVMLRPQMSEVKSRREVDTSVQFGPFTLEVPIISAPMDTVSGETMIRELADLGGIGTIPRNDNNIGEVARLSRRLQSQGVPFVAAIGLKNAYDDASRLKDNGAQVIMIDVAHGGMNQVLEAATAIKRGLDLTIIAGNIAAYDQAKAYHESGVVDMARVGVGPGGLCKTRLVAGTGVPQVSAILDTTETGIYVIADGGIREPGDVAKAIAAGARAVMIGTLFGGTNEAPGEVVDGRKVIRGQASESYMQDNGVSLGEFRAAEGITTTVPLKGPVRDIFHELTGGLRSAMSYTGARNLAEFAEKAQFVKASPASYEYESAPHIHTE